MPLKNLQGKIKDKTAVIGVIGMGYVGLPLACVLAEAGFNVTGLEIKLERVQMINTGVSPIEGIEPGLQALLKKVVEQKKFRATTESKKLADADIILINVETPVEADHKPRYNALRSACQAVGPVLKQGALVIVESTVAPGTARKLVIPELEKASGWKLNEGFFLGVCPERVMPGKLLANLRELSRVCGGSTPGVAETMVLLYRTFVKADLDTADLVTAELVKTAENAYRDVQIAFANEVALICEQNGADVFRVRELVNKSPNRQMHMPGAGVGGHCIPKDPWLLAFSVEGRQPLRVIPAARAINDGMPHHIAKLVFAALKRARRSIARSKAAVLGVAYLENSDDTRNSPSLELVKHLRKQGIETVMHDPWVEPYRKDALEVIKGCDAAVVMVAHADYYKLDLTQLRTALRTPILVDGRHVFSAEAARKAGLDYTCVGQGKELT